MEKLNEKQIRKMLRTEKVVNCLDVQSYIRILVVAIAMEYTKSPATAKIVKAYS